MSKRLCWSSGAMEEVEVLILIWSPLESFLSDSRSLIFFSKYIDDLDKGTILCSDKSIENESCMYAALKQNSFFKVLLQRIPNLPKSNHPACSSIPGHSGSTHHHPLSTSLNPTLFEFQTSHQLIYKEFSV